MRKKRTDLTLFNMSSKRSFDGQRLPSVGCSVGCFEMLAMDDQMDRDKPDKVEDISDAALMREIKARGLEADMVEGLEDDALLRISMARGIYPIFDARPTRLIHELRRQGTGTSFDAYYHYEKINNTPHCSDEVGAVMTVPIPHPANREIAALQNDATRPAKRQRGFIIKYEPRYEPKAISDYTL